MLPARLHLLAVETGKAEPATIWGGTPEKTYLDVPQRKSTRCSPCAGMVTVRVSV
jgi:hypothetical protein